MKPFSQRKLRAGGMNWQKAPVPAKDTVEAWNLCYQWERKAWWKEDACEEGIFWKSLFSYPEVRRSVAYDSLSCAFCLVQKSALFQMQLLH